MVQFINGQIERNEYSTIPYTWICGEQPNNSICIMLPGLGYTTQRPLFHYSTNVCVNNRLDILHINYQYSQNEFFKKLSGPEQDQWMYEDVTTAVREVLKENEYEKCFLLSKSLGSIPAAKEWKHRNLENTSSGIWLTPLLKDDNVFQAILNSDLPSLVVIGDKDPHYIEDRVDKLKQNQLVTIVVIPNADHSLEIKGDITATIDAIKEGNLKIQEFIQR
ncbi:alpha/beta family hydrolase [Neobacillus kokaensis]|uniref:KANL3/Tex30 alpha/beta hydrolase-like domain-containing protein n=1 Tax=Neobacillus kokaensis TaxID=2759023 RepID=A0ABQ3N9D5_9BACI|nr:alpha/beta family hydrolase [Neobacillus kokaensis]GHI00814.1 hypothetical protein AM1BK_43560 [Neobacillus kokaensis]